LQERAILNLVLFTVMCVSFLLFHIWLRTQVLTIGFEVSKSKAQIARVESELALQNSEWNRQRSPAALERYLARRYPEGASPFRVANSNQILYDVKSEAETPPMPPAAKPKGP